MRLALSGIILSVLAFVNISIAEKINPSGCLDCFNFVAPSILGAENLNPAEVGLIVYDSEIDQFRGYSQFTGWQELTNKMTVQTISSTTTLTSIDNIVFVNAGSGALTVNLPSAINLEGKIYQVKKTDSTFSIVTIDGNSSETIDGDISTGLATKGESLKIISDGSNWKILDHVISSEWQAYTPTGSWNTGVTYRGMWRRVGDSIEIQVSLQITGTPNNTDLTFTNAQLFNGLSGLTVNSSKLASPGGNNDPATVGVGAYDDQGTANRGGLTAFWDTGASLLNIAGPDFSDLAQNAPITWASGDAISFKVTLPIVGWRSN